MSASNPLDAATLRAHIDRLELFLGYGSDIDEELHAAVRAGVAVLTDAMIAQRLALAEAAAPRPVEPHCVADVCDAAKVDGICCAPDECDIDSGVRQPPPPAEAREDQACGQCECCAAWRQTDDALREERDRLKTIVYSVNTPDRIKAAAAQMHARCVQAVERFSEHAFHCETCKQQLLTVLWAIAPKEE